MSQVSKVFHANVYIDGTNSQLGRLSEAKLPDISPKMVEHMAMGSFGTLELPSGLAVLTMTAKWNGYYADVWKTAANPFTTRRIQVRGNHETYDENGRVAELPLVVTVSGRWKKAGGATFKGQESGEFDDEVTCTYIKSELDGEVLYEIDIMNNVYIVAGEDLLETMRKNLGL